MAAVAEEERRRLIKRTQAGVERAQRQGKWLGNVPAGFARDLPALTRQGLMNIHTDDERRWWYLDATADDERVSNALDSAEPD